MAAEVEKQCKLRVSDSLVKSASDKRNYRALVLENDMQVMLISDKDTDKAAAALSVAAGKNKSNSTPVKH